ncbi:MAG: hypothetical protein PUI15_05835 [Lachnospiraceae bacterium]|nr:hypothetical protein [Lachnospiraceae bacterium]
MKETTTAWNVWKSGDRKKRLLLGAVLLLVLAASAFRVYLAWRAPYVFQTIAEHDDALQVKQAYNLLQSRWLGSYDQRTLSKGISFPVFLAVLNRLHIPYGMGLGFFMVLASACVMASLRPVFGNLWFRLCGYAALLYNPLGFSTHLALRIYRSSLTPWACLLVLAAFTGIFLRRRDPLRYLIFWSLLGVVSLPFFWYLREDSVWLAPYVLLASLITTLIWIFGVKRRGVSLLLSILSLLLPFGSLYGVRKVQEAENLKCYQIAAVNDRSETNFAVVMNLLHHIDDGTGRMDRVREQDQEWVSREAMQQAVSVSPALQEIQEEIQDYWDAWAGDNGRIEGDTASWMLRDAVYAGGYYKDGATADAWYGTVAEELEKAFREGTLKERKAVYLSSQAKGFQAKDFIESIPLMFQTFQEDAAWTWCTEEENVSQGTIEQLQLWEGVLRTYTVIPDSVLQNIKENPEQTEYGLQREALNGLIAQRQKRVAVLANGIAGVWKVLSVPLMILAILGYLCTIAGMIRDRKRDPEKRWFSLWLVMTGVLLSAWLDIYMVCLFSRWLVGAFAGIFSFYGNVAYTLIVLLEIMGIGCLIRAGREMLADRKKTEIKK